MNVGQSGFHKSNVSTLEYLFPCINSDRVGAVLDTLKGEDADYARQKANLLVPMRTERCFDGIDEAEMESRFEPCKSKAGSTPSQRPSLAATAVSCVYETSSELTEG